MVAETLELLAPARGGLFVDCTVGLGGHARALLEAGATRILGLDRDPDALKLAASALAEFGDRVELVHADYRDLPQVLDQRGLTGVDGALADLGVSSMQLEAEGRGFSFRRDDPLDMRMDRSQGETAADWLAAIDEESLADVIFQYGEERYSRRIARAIVSSRNLTPIRTTAALARSCAAQARGAAISASTRRREPSRRCEFGPTGNSNGSIASSPRPRSGCWAGHAWR